MKRSGSGYSPFGDISGLFPPGGGGAVPPSSMPVPAPVAGGPQAPMGGSTPALPMPPQGMPPVQGSDPRQAMLAEMQSYLGNRRR